MRRWFDEDQDEFEEMTREEKETEDNDPYFDVEIVYRLTPRRNT